jgi:hypothetical protein
MYFLFDGAADGAGCGENGATEAAIAEGEARRFIEQSLVRLKVAMLL